MKKNTIAEKHLPDIPAFAEAAMAKKNITRAALARKLKWAGSAVTLLFKRRNWEIA